MTNLYMSAYTSIVQYFHKIYPDIDFLYSLSLVSII